MSEDNKKLMQDFTKLSLPVFVAIIGFFAVQTYQDIQQIKATLINYNLAVTELQTEMKNNSVQMMELKQDIKDLQRANKERDNWVREWQEKYMGAVEWAKKNAPQ